MTFGPLCRYTTAERFVQFVVVFVSDPVLVLKPLLFVVASEYPPGIGATTATNYHIGLGTRTLMLCRPVAGMGLIQTIAPIRDRCNW